MRRATAWMMALAALGLWGCETPKASSAPAPAAPAAQPAPKSAVEALRPFYAAYGGTLAERAASPALPGGRLSRLAFGSCMEETKAAPILKSAIAAKPDLFVMLGDNVYGDMATGDVTLPELRKAYADMAANADFATLSAAIPILPVWDDHDYGLNDAGADFAPKEFAQRLFNTFWRVPEGDPRRSRDGTYASQTFGPKGEEVHVILLDTRFFRSPLKETDQRNAEGKERYLPDDDPSKTMLGATQWAWLEAELAKPAALTVLVSSIQVIADGHGWEAWRTLPRERAKLYGLIATAKAQRLVIVSGDRHRGGLYKADGVTPAPLYELTASSLNLPVRAWGGKEEPGPNRIGPTYLDENYGQLDIDWAKRALTLSVRGMDGASVQAVTVPLGG